MDDAELQNPDNWDFEGAQMHPPVENAGAVVSVRFDGQEFDTLMRYAEFHGLRLTEAIKQAVLERASAPRVRWEA